MSLVTPVVDEGLGNTSWLVDVGDDRLAVIDPGRHPGPYLAAAERNGGRVAYSVETHLHADFVTGSRELATYGATVIAPADGELAWPHHPIGGGDAVGLGGLTLQALPTPGHTPEHLAYLLSDGATPLGVFTGGSLLVGAVARTDLIAPERTDELARALWRSLHEQVLTLPDDLPVYPTHGAGSFCAAPAGDRRWSTIGDERRSNPLLAAADEDAFVAALQDGLGTYPPFFAHLRAVNQTGPGVLGIPQPPLPQLAVDEAEAGRRWRGARRYPPGRCLGCRPRPRCVGHPAAPAVRVVAGLAGRTRAAARVRRRRRSGPRRAGPAMPPDRLRQPDR